MGAFIVNRGIQDTNIKGFQKGFKNKFKNVTVKTKGPLDPFMCDSNLAKLCETLKLGNSSSTNESRAHGESRERCTNSKL